MEEPLFEEPLFHEALSSYFTHARRYDPTAPRTVDALVKATGYKKSSIYDYLNGTRLPSADALDKILNALPTDLNMRAKFMRLRDRAEKAERTAKLEVAEVGCLHNLPGESAVYVGGSVDTLARFTAENGHVAVHGLGGVGKTELALQWAHTMRGRHQVVWWINSQTAGEVRSGLAALARRLRSNPRTTDASAAAWSINWLRTHDRWTLVLDNVDRLDDVADVLAELRKCGILVITTRLNVGVARWKRHGLMPLELDVLARPAAVDLLCRLTGSSDRQAADRLAAVLGDLPLAIGQAAAFVTQQPSSSLDQYRELLAAEFARVAAFASVDDPSERTIAVTWNVTTERIAEQDPLASRVISVISQLGGRDLPDLVLQSLADELDLARSLAILNAYHMIRRTGAGITIHPLVASVTRARDTDALLHRALAVDSILAVVPDDPFQNVSGWSLWSSLIPHIDALIARLPTEEHDRKSLELLDRAATYLQGQGEIKRSIGWFETLVEESSGLFGSDDDKTLQFVAHLAFACSWAGHIGLALRYFERLVPAFAAKHGPTSVETLQVRGMLAEAHRLRGNPEIAVSQFRQLLVDARGTELDIFTTRTFLGAAYADAGRLAEAIAELEDLYQQEGQNRGLTHPATLVARHNLARARLEAGDVASARAELTDILAEQIEALGPKHPHTLATRGNLARADQAAGVPLVAVEKFETLLSDLELALGPGNPATLTTARYLANAHRAAGSVESAVHQLELVLEQHVRHLGPQEPLTLLARNDLGKAYEDAARPDGALATYLSLLADQEQVLGPDHAATLATRRAVERCRRDG
ncbi:FxSxx-COOH system tetratricopeptide repeat protein [Catellatospora sp. KI3]|uniref:FxSxx-COOH system tetratricopeptide repeat protein n=1 Tax=Catellatospora sp. KI3 TaxID=3041620 RepID=UPI002482E7A6|nr:FxSxx-COOH system tetratricopeptide repeat protein [Catellatospora sp. KI3]MDI1466106.1 FxSxx-COOH system tetratricopeptide repeat protein [Catellatospora sp. KI3]